LSNSVIISLPSHVFSSYIHRRFYSMVGEFSIIIVGYF
jgi:hypothetical protein